LLGGMLYRVVGFNGTIMRHLLRLLVTIASLPGSVVQPPLWAFLVTYGGSSLGFLTCRQRTGLAIDVTPITATADYCLCMASSAVVEPRCVVSRICLSLGHDSDQASLKGLSWTGMQTARFISRLHPAQFPLLGTAHCIVHSNSIKAKPCGRFAALTQSAFPIQSHHAK
jgi:hypothetical protein